MTKPFHMDGPRSYLSPAEFSAYCRRYGINLREWEVRDRLRHRHLAGYKNSGGRRWKIPVGELGRVLGSAGQGRDGPKQAAVPAPPLEK